MSTPRRRKRASLALLVACLLAPTLATIGLAAPAVAQTATAQVQHEINTLFRALERSNCQFNRNGTWYDGKQAATHLRRKYDHLRKKGLLTTTEAFIDNAASRSSMSGQAYRVRCGAKPAMESRQWFTSQLGKLRAP